ncbi:MAG: histidine kinase [Bacteroidota bacterium]
MKIYKKYGIRLLVALFIYFFFHVNSSDSFYDIITFGTLDSIFIVYVIVIVLGILELLDWLLVRLNAKHIDFTRYSQHIRLAGILTLVTLPLVVFFSWFSEYGIKSQFIVCDPADSLDAFIRMSFQGQVLAWLIIGERIFRITQGQAKQMERDKALMQKELLQSQYVNLKNQVNPHFLFNSFSVLQSLIDTRPQEASKFLSELSRMYRYILDNRQESMSSLKKELEILQSYLYLLRIRHEESLHVLIDIDPRYHDCYVPTLSLQMLIENAEKHNQFSRIEPLSVKIYVDGEYLVVRNKVKKKGAGEGSTRLGLENLRSQYELQTERAVIITQDDNFFTVKLPVLSGIRFA